MSIEITITVNGTPYSFIMGSQVPESETLVETIRERLMLTGTL